MATMTLSAKRQVVLPADLCQWLSLAPGSKVAVRLAPDGGSILIEPARPALRKPASVLFGRVTHGGKPVVIDEMDAAVVATQQQSRDSAALAPSCMKSRPMGKR